MKLSETDVTSSYRYNVWFSRYISFIIQNGEYSSKLIISPILRRIVTAGPFLRVVSISVALEIPNTSNISKYFSVDMTSMCRSFTFHVVGAWYTLMTSDPDTYGILPLVFEYGQRMSGVQDLVLWSLIGIKF